MENGNTGKKSRTTWEDVGLNYPTFAFPVSVAPCSQTTGCGGDEKGGMEILF